MDKKPINLVNPLDVENYLKKFCNEDPYLELLLITALAKIIKKSPECMETLTAPPSGSPTWLTQKWSSQPEWHSFAPKKDIKLTWRVYEAVKWIQLAIEHDLEWLKNTDDKGRPKKLLKLSTFDQLWPEIESDKQRIKDRQRKEGRKSLQKEVWRRDIINIMNFDDGFQIVKLLTERALDRESAFLEHCIGDGLYDEHLKNQSLYYYSLRAPGNIPCVTISLDPQYQSVNYIAGKRNATPDAKYMRHICTFCHEYKVDMSWFFRFQEGYKVVDSRDLKLYNTSETIEDTNIELPELEFKNLEDDIVIADGTQAKSLHISRISNLKKFPKNVTIKGPVYFFGKGLPKKKPVGWTVTGKIVTNADSFNDWDSFLNKYYPKKS